MHLDQHKMAANWKDFSESTTFHGFRFLNTANSRIRRVVWLLFVLSSFAFFTSQFYKSLKEFFDYKVNTIVYMSNDHETKFPAITICNQNTLRKSKAEANMNEPAVQKLMRLTRQYLKFDKKGTNTSEVNDTIVTGKRLREVYFQYGHTMQNITNGGMLLFCRTPKGEVCTEGDFYRTLTFSGLCYTLNSGKGKGVAINSAISGRFGAIKVMMSAQVNEYSGAIGRTSSTGIVVLIHDQKDPPVADTHGMFIGPGLAASIAIRKQKVESLKRPYESKCRDEELVPGYPYSRSGCFRMCQEKYVIKRCNCSIPLETIIKPTNVPVCDLDRTFQCAIPKATEEFNQEKSNCDCPFACESVEYMSTLSYSPYPSDIDARKLSIEELENEGKNVTDDAIFNKTIELRKNMIQLEIFYQQMDYLTIKAVPAYTPVKIFAEIGGLLGISLGASFLTIMELADFVAMLILQKATRGKVVEVAPTDK